MSVRDLFFSGVTGAMAYALALDFFPRGPSSIWFDVAGLVLVAAAWTFAVYGERGDAP